MVLGVICLCGGGGAARATLRDGLVGYWKLDESAIGADTVAADSSGRGHAGAYVGMPTVSTKVPALPYANPRSVAFVRASHQAVRVADMPAELKPAAVTISAWYLATSTDADRAELVSGGDSYIIYLSRDGLGAGRRQAGSWSDVISPVPALLDGKWHHVAATIDDEALKVFFDGAFVAAMPSTGAITYDLGTDLWLGRYGYGTRARDFEGNLDEVAIFNRVLDAGEIAELAHGGQPGAVVVAPVDAGVDAPPEAPAVTPDASPVPDAAVEAIVDAPAVVEVAPPVVQEPPPPPPPTTVDAAVDVVPVVTTPQARAPHQYHDVPQACAAAPGEPEPVGLALLAALLVLSGTRHRARPCRR